MEITIEGVKVEILDGLTESDPLDSKDGRKDAIKVGSVVGTGENSTMGLIDDFSEIDIEGCETGSKVFEFFCNGEKLGSPIGSEDE